MTTDDQSDWEDPWDHLFLTMCTGCAMCAPWEGRTFDDIRAEHDARTQQT